MCCNTTICFKIRVIKYKFCCKYMISQPLPNFKSQFSQNVEAGSYDNIALNQRYYRRGKTGCHLNTSFLWIFVFAQIHIPEASIARDIKNYK